MARDTLDTNPPPPLPPPDGFQYYLPELYYFRDSKEVELGIATLVTALCVAQWCDEFRVQAVHQVPLNGPSKHWPGREGKLPPKPQERRAAVSELFEWLERTRGQVYSPISLVASGVPLLTGDMIPFLLTLRPDQFGEVQDCWERSRLPRDLCYPAPAQREISEHVAIGGENLRMQQRYTPKRWQLRNMTAEDDAHPGDEEERRARFVAACSQFLSALVLRELELRETRDDGVEADAVEVDSLRKAGSAVGAALLEARRRMKVDRERS